MAVIEHIQTRFFKFLPLDQPECITGIIISNYDGLTDRFGEPVLWESFMKARAFLAYTLDPFARELNADVSLFCFFFFFTATFYTKQKMFESLNIIIEMFGVRL